MNDLLYNDITIIVKWTVAEHYICRTAIGYIWMSTII